MVPRIVADAGPDGGDTDSPCSVKRITLKVDVLVVVSARVAGAQIFYSHDRKCRRLAALAKLEARDLPTHHENMFTVLEMRRGES